MIDFRLMTLKLYWEKLTDDDKDSVIAYAKNIARANDPKTKGRQWVDPSSKD
jgi:hypothetical protein